MRIYESPIRLTPFALAIVCVTAALSSPANGQEPATLGNGDMEELTEEGLPEVWSLYGRNQTEWREAGVWYSVEKDNPASGNNCLLIDTSNLKTSTVGAWQHFNATEYAGKRVNLRAAIRMDVEEDTNPDEVAEDEEEESGTASLAIRVYRENEAGYLRPVALEYAPRGPFTNARWKRVSIVIDIPEKAEIIETGLEVVGKTRAWFDDVSLEVVDENTELTSPSLFDGPQPFLTWWLILPAIAFSLFVVAYCGTGPLQRFAIRFAVAYWVIYFLNWWIGLFSFTEIDFTDLYLAKAGVVSWLTWNLFQTDVFPMSTGSGDGLYNYAELLCIFVYSIGVAIVWSFLDWRKTSYVWLRDMLRSFLRYSLAIVLLAYGLGKLYPEFTQFPVPSFDRLKTTYGESSPMGLLWTFMGASQPYTIFAGLGEVVAALLLVWRRTTIIGAFVAIGVMGNVVMLNFCYDVPVKLFSTHLLIAAIIILLPDVSRITKAFFTHDVLDRAELRPPYVSPLYVWHHRALKTGLIVLAILYPAFETIDSWSTSKKPDFFGDYAVEAIQSPHNLSDQADQGVAGADASDSQLKKFNFARIPYAMEEDQEHNYTDIIAIASGRGSGGGSYSQAIVRLDSDAMEMEVVDFHGRKRDLPDKFRVRVIDEDQLELVGQMDEGKWVVKLRRRKGEFLLKSRGFRWVNQRPFNR